MVLPIKHRVNDSPRFNPPCPKCNSYKAKKGFTKLVCFECGHTCTLKEALKSAKDKKLILKECGGWHKVRKTKEQPAKRIRRGRGKNKEPSTLRNWGNKQVGFAWLFQ